MQNDLFDRSFKAAAAKYKRMHGLEQQQTEAEDRPRKAGHLRNSKRKTVTPLIHPSKVAWLNYPTRG
ncbi:TPA: hypothetical protein ACH3X3_004336 [Trebouxia sp. C0006]